MIAVTVDRLIGYGPLLSVSCEWFDFDEEDQRRATADGEWEVRCWTASGEYTLASGHDYAAAKELALRIGAYFSVLADV